MDEDILPVTVPEAWAIHEFFRRPDRVELDKEIMFQAMQVILGNSSSLLVDDGTLWALDRQIPPDLQRNIEGVMKPVGRELLLKVMALIVKLRREESRDDREDDRDTSSDPGEDAGGDAHPTLTP